MTCKRNGCVRDCIRWDQMGSNGIGWDQMGSDGIRWDQMGSDGMPPPTELQALTARAASLTPTARATLCAQTVKRVARKEQELYLTGSNAPTQGGVEWAPTGAEAQALAAQAVRREAVEGRKGVGGALSNSDVDADGDGVVSVAELEAYSNSVAEYSRTAHAQYLAQMAKVEDRAAALRAELAQVRGRGVARPANPPTRARCAPTRSATLCHSQHVRFFVISPTPISPISLAPAQVLAEEKELEELLAADSLYSAVNQAVEANKGGSRACVLQ